MVSTDGTPRVSVITPTRNRVGHLAGAVRNLAADAALAQRIAARGRATYERHASEAVLGPRWRGIIERLA